ncbi:MAG: amidohydrolase [Bacteroidia bacterium]|nr:MAG: amidohydrolase [Bacteroidia bacterium]
MKNMTDTNRIPLYGKSAVACILSLFLFLFISCKNEPDYYSVDDFEEVEKIDVHFHYLSMDTRYMEFASSLNFRLLSPNWDGEVSIDEQLKISKYMHGAYPETFAFLGTFSVDRFISPGFAESTRSRIQECMDAGASGIKIWKNIGMVLQDRNGGYVMIDDQAFEGIIHYLEENQIPVMAHLGEPKDCWLPEAEMTDPSDLVYYRNNPQYYMYLHPEVPSYEEQIRARDHLLEMHSDLDFIGAHLGSLEWSVDELAKRLDLYPNFKVDIASRIYHLQYQSKTDREKVRDFMIKYQGRILYGTDMEVHDMHEADVGVIEANLLRTWKSHWIYLATDSLIQVEGLQLPKEVIDKIYFKNALPFFR